ncbi:tyrosine-type recombinase/integrase [Eubacterium callanderi]|jgi:integrase|uniref:tyrosine-type recombinase/integrase n=1 Tax=Eubacterium callanderi TaxID=53442 RepID=UPI001D13B5DF|nr:site-specific integrase [Eubacterium callanderi]MCC3402675.1 site-specific integrase [Eubacterium callanderi]
MKKQEFKVKATLQKKNNFWYVVCDYKDGDGKRKQPWLKTGIPVKNGSEREKNKLISLVEEKRKELERSLFTSCDTLFVDYAQQWINDNAYRYAEVTVARYRSIIKVNIAKYFQPLKLTLSEVDRKDLEGFYQSLFREGKTPKTISTIRGVVRNILEAAEDDELILNSPYNKAKCIVPNRVKNNLEDSFDYLRREEISTVLEIVKPYYLYPMVYIAINYGLRPGELLGLRWQSIDLENGRMDINFSAIQVEHTMIYKKTLKNKYSQRSFVLSKDAIRVLKAVKAEQEENRKYYGNCYYKQEHDFVFLQENGKPFQEKFVMRELQRKLVKNGFRKIRLYDLRHTCCSLMINARNREGGPAFSPKEIMEYMGHSSIKTTMNVYAHVEEKIQREIPDKIAALISGDGQVVNTNKKAS